MQYLARYRSPLAALALATLTPTGAQGQQGTDRAGEPLRREDVPASLANPQIGDLTVPRLTAAVFPAPTSPAVSVINPVLATETNKEELNKTAKPAPQGRSREDFVDFSKEGLISRLKHFISDNLVGALGTAAVVMFGLIRGYLRIFPNKIHVDAFVLGRLPRNENEAQGRSVFHAQTIETSTLSGIFGANIAAMVSFNVAMWRARHTLYWPMLVFSNSKVMNRLLHGGPHEIIARPFRSELSSRFSDDIYASSHSAALKRQEAITSGSTRDLFQPVSGTFVVCTYERVTDIQPRAYLLPQQDVVSFLLLLPEVHKAAKDTGGEAMRRLVRVLEICGSIVLRYPTALKNLGLGEHLPKAQAIAQDLFRMYALQPEESRVFLERYISGDRSHLEPTAKERQRMRTLWYASSDEVHQAKCEEAERNMPSFFHYGRMCARHRIPMWLYFLSLPRVK
jgi:hypothetical protein